MAEQTPPLINPSGKQQLLANGKWISAHRDMLSHPQWQISLNLALLQYSKMMTMPNAPAVDGNMAAQCLLKLKGAQEFVEVLLNMTEVARPAILQKPSQASLDHGA